MSTSKGNVIGRKSTNLLNSMKEVKANIQQAAVLFKSKGYPCEYEHGNPKISKYPFLSFEEGINDYSFTNIPDELFAERRFGNFVMGIEVSPEEKQPEDAASKSKLLYEYARKIKSARRVFCEIDVPAGEEPEDFFNWAVADEFDVDRLDYDGPFGDEDEDETNYTITFELIVSIDNVKSLDKSIREFGEFHEVLATTIVM
ncbi:MAG: hypothetical protein LWX56_00725 [Ignavibacteria bacterium]|nr:hypothetical protein [Ignavibacteria bacterium]